MFCVEEACHTKKLTRINVPSVWGPPGPLIFLLLRVPCKPFPQLLMEILSKHFSHTCLPLSSLAKEIYPRQGNKAQKIGNAIIRTKMENSSFLERSFANCRKRDQVIPLLYIIRAIVLPPKKKDPACRIRYQVHKEKLGINTKPLLKEKTNPPATGVVEGFCIKSCRSC